LRPELEILQLAMGPFPICVVGAAVSLANRYRRSRGVERLQLKWMGAAAAAVLRSMG
jgi:hypothetical protein